MRRLDYARFQDGGLLPHLGPPGKGLELLLHNGIYKTDFIHDWITEALATCNVHTWRQLKYTDSGADANLPPERRYKLVVIVSDLSRGRMLRLP
jgi:NTE family protein